MIKIKKWGLALALPMLLLACTQERGPCLTPKTASFNIVCVHLTTDTGTIPVDTTLPAAVFGAVTQGGNKLLVYAQSAKFTISLASNADSCTWLFTTDSLYHPFDTINFYYKRELQFLSNACGYAYFYNLDTFHITHHNIDSAHLLARSITNDINTTQFQIYIHPDF